MKSNLIFSMLALGFLCLASTGCSKDNSDDAEQHFDPKNVLTAINDAVFHEYCVLQMSVWDTDGNGKLSPAEAAAVTKIDLSVADGPRVASLAGLEYFTGLLDFNCSNNTISAFDLSHNTALTTLDCSANTDALKTLDVSHNPALTSLDCSRNFNLTQLQLPSQSRLTYLNAENTTLESLDVLANDTALTYLNAGGLIKPMDVSKNTALTMLIVHFAPLDVSQNTQLAHLECDGAQLASLDISHNPALTYLSCGHSSLTALDTSNNSALEYLDCTENQISVLDLSRNTALTWLNCGANQLTSLDLSHNTALTGFQCTDNPLTTLDISNNTALTMCIVGAPFVFLSIKAWFDNNHVPEGFSTGDGIEYHL